MGINSPETIIAEGVNIGHEQRQLSIQQANELINKITLI